MATLDKGFNDIDSEVEVETPWGKRLGKVSPIPFN